MRSPCVGRAHGVRQLVPFLALVLLGVAAAAHADALKCTRTVAKASAAFAQAKVKALQKCDDQVLRHTIAGPCPDGTAAARIAKAESKLRAKVSSDCGGSDHVCGTGGDEPLGGIGWGGGACPNLEQGSCGTALTDCNGISDCLACVDEAAVDQAIGLYYGSADPDTTNSDVVKCQRAIGKYTTKFVVAKSKALQRCEDHVLTGRFAGACPDAGQAAPAIAKAESKKRVGICKACGGPDKACDGVEDLDAATIGFPSECLDVTIPGGLPCAGAITSLQDVVNCVTCVTEYKDDCLDPIAVPAVKPTYPNACNPPLAPPCAATPNGTATPCPTVTPGLQCPTKVVTIANGDGVDLDSGWTGLSHDAHAPDGSKLTLGLDSCTQPNPSTCGVCNTTGPLDNAGGTAFNDHRCLLDTSVECTTDPDCASVSRTCINSNVCVGGLNDGAACSTQSECPGTGGSCTVRTCSNDAGCQGCQGGGNSGAPCTAGSECPGGSCAGSGTCAPSVCTFFFGSPLPLSSGGVTVCVTNQIVGSVSGTVDIEAGTTETTIPLLSIVHLGALTLDKPCPLCDTLRCHSGSNDGAPCAVTSECPGGTCGLSCTGGPRDTLACTVNGTTSLFGPVSFDCPPSPSSDVGHLPITLDYTTGTQTRTLTADNPNCNATGYETKKCFCDTCNNLAATPCASNTDCVAAGATICGGKRCLAGPNLGLPCTLQSDCPGTCTAGPNAGAACTTNSECPGLAACSTSCGVPGQATQPNQCSDDTCSPTMTCLGGCNAFLNCSGAFHCVAGTNAGALCTVDSECPSGSCDEQCPGGTCVTGNEGKCDAGPFEQFCSTETFRQCNNDGGCPKPGDHCTLGKFRDCFLDNGVLGASVTVTGTSYPGCGDTGTGTVGALFCIPPTSAGSVNAVSGLPGLGRVTLPYTATFLP